MDHVQKRDFLKKARALIFPEHWPEPFGLTLIEAMACGTPAIASRSGSVPEIVIEGVTGFMCDSVEEMALALRRIKDLDRAECRQRVETAFSAQTIASGYEAAYHKILSRARSAGS